MTEAGSHRDVLHLIEAGRTAVEQMRSFSSVIADNLDTRQGRKLKRRFRDDLVDLQARLDSSATALALELDRAETGIDPPSVFLELQKSKRAIERFKEGSLWAIIVAGAIGGIVEASAGTLYDEIRKETESTESAVVDLEGACLQLNADSADPDTPFGERRSEQDSPPGKKDVEGSSAHQLRRQLSSMLKNARADAELSQQEAAEALQWSVSKMIRLEGGAVPPAPSDVRAMLELYGLEDEAVGDAIDLARKAREARDWDDYSDVLSPAFRDMIGAESSAADIFKFEPAVVPGYLQTDGYSRELQKMLGLEGQVRQRNEVDQMRRQLFDAENKPEIVVVFGETALVRAVGDTATMREQLGYLLELNSRPWIELFVLPDEEYDSLPEQFTLLDFEGNQDPDVLYLSDASRSATSAEDGEAVARYSDLFDQLKLRAEQSGSFEDHVGRILDDFYT